MVKHYAQNFEEEQLIRQFRRIRRREVILAWVITFIVWLLVSRGDLLTSLVISLIVGAGRWLVITWKMR